MPNTVSNNRGTWNHHAVKLQEKILKTSREENVPTACKGLEIRIAVDFFTALLGGKRKGAMPSEFEGRGF